MTAQRSHSLVDPASSAALDYARNGSAESLSQALSACADAAFTQARRLLRCEADAEDAVQDAFISLARLTRRYDGSSPFGAWVSRRVHFACLDQLRLRRHRRSDPATLGQLAAPEPTRVHPDAEKVATAVCALPERFRSVVNLHYFGGLSQADTASVMGLTISAVAQRLHRAREILRQRLTGTVAGEAGVVAVLVAQPQFVASQSIHDAIMGPVAHAAAMPVHPHAIQKGWSFLMHHPLLSLGSVAGLIVVAAMTLPGADRPHAAEAKPTKIPAIAGDWPQYRGPTRDGIAPAGPKLLDRWPADGPKLLWKTAPLWPEKGGLASGGGHLAHSGCGSISIAGGRAFLFANFRGQTGKVMLSTKDLNDLGWIEGVPDDLANKVEEERTHGGASKLKPGPEADAYAKKYAAEVAPDAMRKFASWIERRLRKEDASTTTHVNRLLQPDGSIASTGDQTFEWSFLEKLATVRDKEFATIDDLDKQTGGALNPWTSSSGNAIKVWLANRSISFLDRVICLDAVSGAEIWRKDWPGNVTPWAQAANVGASCTPAVSDGRCYIVGSAGVYCLSVKDGAVIWQVKAGFSNSSPVVINGVIYAMVPEATAYDAKTGRVLWCQPSLRHPNASFTTWNGGGKSHLLIGFEGNAYSNPPGCIFCIDPSDGRQLWSTPCSGNQLPVIANDTLVTDSTWGCTMAFRLSPEKAEMLWKTTTGSAARGESPLIFQDHVYSSGACHSDAPVRCLDLKDGSITWQPHKLNSAESSSPILADGKIIALFEENEDSLLAVMYKATPEKYEELGRFNPHAGPGASPAIAGGRLYLRLLDGVACYDLTQR